MSAGTQTKIALVKIFNNKEFRELGGRIILIIHDEIICQCPIQNIKRCSEILADTMSNAIPDCKIPFPVDVETSIRWYGKSYDPDELIELYNKYAGRPSLLYFAEKMTKDLNGPKIYIKREDLNHTGSHKINNVLGQLLLAKKMGKKRIIAETGAGQHGVATATVAALLGLECSVYMGEEDMERQSKGLKG